MMPQSRLIPVLGLFFSTSALAEHHEQSPASEPSALPAVMVPGAQAHPTVGPKATLPLRPTTFPVDDLLTDAPVENFRDLYVNPNKLANQLEPVESLPGDKAVLPINNDSTSWAEISVNGTKVGTMGPLTVGAIHDVKPGVYDVNFVIMTGYSETRQVGTQVLHEAIIPGGEAARVSLEQHTVNQWTVGFSGDNTVANTKSPSPVQTAPEAHTEPEDDGPPPPSAPPRDKKRMLLERALGHGDCGQAAELLDKIVQEDTNAQDLSSLRVQLMNCGK